jgi:hypothetical protein
MAKRRDNDATMDVSMSQLVPDAPQRPRSPSAAPQGRGSKAPIAQNDMSVWKQVVVSSDDFAPPTKKVRHGGGGLRWVIAGAVLAVGAAGGIFAWRQLASDPGKPAATAASASDPAKPAPVEAPAPAAAIATGPAKPAETEPAAPTAAVAPAGPAGPTWFEELAMQLASEPTWFSELGASFASALDPASAPAPGKKPAAAPGKRTAAVRAPAKKPTTSTKKPATTTTTTKRRP